MWHASREGWKGSYRFGGWGVLTGAEMRSRDGQLYAESRKEVARYDGPTAWDAIGGYDGGKEKEEEAVPQIKGRV